MLRLRRTAEQELESLLDDARAAEIEIESADTLLALGREVNVHKLIETSRELLRLLDRQRLYQEDLRGDWRAELLDVKEERDQAQQYASDLEKQLEEETTRANTAEDERDKLKEQQPPQKKTKKKS